MKKVAACMPAAVCSTACSGSSCKVMLSDGKWAPSFAPVCVQPFCAPGR